MQGSTRGVPIDTDNTLSLDSDIVVASQKAVKAYVTAQMSLTQPVLGYTPVDVAGATMTGYLTLNNDPVNLLHAATKQYVDNVVSGVNFHKPAHAATTGNLSATYSNGTAGVGATLTATANGALVVDGHTLLVNERVLVWQQTSGLQNGIYDVTQTGSPSTPFILTRANDDDQSPSEMAYGDFCFVQQGTLYGGYGFINNTSGTITIGVTAITYVQFNAAQVVAAGYGLLESTPNVLSVDTTVIAPINSPAFTGTVTGITKSMVGLGSVVNADTTTTANITDSTNKRFVTDAQLVVIGNTSGTNTGDETGSTIKTKLGAATSSVDGYLTSSDWSTFNGKQAALSGTGFVKSTAGVISYDTSTYLTSIGSGTSNTLTYWSSSSAIGSLSTATYPSLTELSYVKGVTSDIQTQINSKGTGTVTSVGLSMPTGFTVGSSPVTGSGSIAVTFTAGYSLPTTTSQNNWDTAYTNRITSLTVTGSSGSATLSSNTLNIPTYTLAGLGGQASSTNLTSLSGLTYASTSFVKMTAANTFALDTNTYLTSISSGDVTTALGYTPVTNARTISTTAPLSGGGDLSANRTLSITQSTTSTDGYLSSTDWNTFNGKVSQLYAYVAAGGTSTSNLTYTDITGLSVTLAASTTYRIECWLNMTSSSTAGLQIGVTFPAGATVGLNGRAPTNSVSAQTYYQLITSGSLGSGNIVTVTTAGAPVHFSGIITVGVTGGVFKVGYAKVTSGTATANFGSHLVATKIA